MTISQSKIDEMNEAFDADSAAHAEEYMPDPVGWRLLVRPIEAEEVSAGGIVLVEETRQLQEHRSAIGLVVDVGPECYEHQKFRTTWVRVGDYVAYKPYAGSGIDVINNEGKRERYRFLNDDEILGTVPNPRRVKYYV